MDDTTAIPTPTPAPAPAPDPTPRTEGCQECTATSDGTACLVCRRLFSVEQVTQALHARLEDFPTDDQIESLAEQLMDDDTVRSWVAEEGDDACDRLLDGSKFDRVVETLLDDKELITKGDLEDTERELEEALEHYAKTEDLATTNEAVAHLTNDVVRLIRQLNTAERQLASHRLLIRGTMICTLVSLLSLLCVLSGLVR